MSLLSKLKYTMPSCTFFYAILCIFDHLPSTHTHTPVVVFDTVDLVFCVHSKRNSIQALVTDDTAEATWMVGLAQGLQDL